MNIKDKAAAFILSHIKNNFLFAEYHKRTTDKRINYKRQPSVMSRKEISDWKMALMSATDPDNPRRGDLMRFYENMKLDGHLMSCCENRILPVQCAPFKLVDENEEENTEAKKLLERPWFLEMAKIICTHTFEGTKLICMFDIDENGELRQVEEVPQSNFVPQKKIVLINEYDSDGIRYDEGAYKNYYFQIGGDWNLGLFSQLAMVIIAKKLGLGSWMSYIDKYGVPPIFAITERMDPARRDELFEMLENFRMNHFAVLQGNEKIETPQGYNVDAHNTFKSLMSDICDREIEKAIQGSSGLTNEKSFVGAAEVQERILNYRHKVDKLIFKYYFNTEVKHRLIKLSPVYSILENLTFDYDETETLTMRELLGAVRDLGAFFEFDVEELTKITGLPITAVKQTLGMVAGASKEEKEEKEEKTEKSGNEEKKENEEKAAAPIGPRAKSDFNKQFLIYAASWDKAYKNVIEKIRRGEIDPRTLDNDFILKTYERLNRAAALGFGAEYYGDEVARKMRENLLRFSATKTFVQQHEIAILSDSIKDDKLFIDEAQKYFDLQNGPYLDVQTAWAARCSQSARQWGEFQRDKDIYPRAKFRTMGDADVRPEHAALEGVVVGIDDPFLDEHMTPLDFGCRCWWEQTREAATENLPDIQTDPQYGGNIGKTGEVFNDSNSYQEKINNKADRLEIRRQAEQLKQHLPYNKIIGAGENRVFVNDFADIADLGQNIEAAKIIAEELKKDIFIRPHIDGGIVRGCKNPELSIGKKSTLGDLKTYNGNSKFENFVENSIKSANAQGADYIVLDIGPKTEYLPTLKRKLSGCLNQRNSNIKRVIVIDGNRAAEITRKQIEKRDFKSLERLKEKRR